MVQQYAYIHQWWQGESFTKKIGRLQQWYQDSLKEPKPQIHPNLSLTKNKPKEKPFSNYSILWHTISLRERHIYIYIYIELRFAAQGN